MKKLLTIFCLVLLASCSDKPPDEMPTMVENFSEWLFTPLWNWAFTVLGWNSPFLEFIYPYVILMLLFIFFQKLKELKNELTKGRSLSLKFFAGIFMISIGVLVTNIMATGWFLIDPSQLYDYTFNERNEGFPVRINVTYSLFILSTCFGLIYLLVWEEIKIFSMRWRDWLLKRLMKKLDRFYNKEKK